MVRTAGRTGSDPLRLAVRQGETIRLILDNQSPMFHCHNLYHSERGMMGVPGAAPLTAESVRPRGGHAH